VRDPIPRQGGGPGAVSRLVDGHLAVLVARLAERRVRRRVTCCLNYTVAAQPCATCPLLPAAETRRRLAAP
jgi:hypothetical protein